MTGEKEEPMKKQQTKRRGFPLLAAVFVICVLFSLKAAALDTPWMTIQPDTGTAENASGDPPQTTSETQAGDPAETVDFSDVLKTAEETENNANSAEQKATLKRGCRSTVHGVVLLCPLLLSTGVLLQKTKIKK